MGKKKGGADKGKDKKGRKSKKGKSVQLQPAAVEAQAAAPVVQEDPCAPEKFCQPNRYPGNLEKPVPLTVVGTEGGSYESLCKLLRAGFRCSDRVLIMTPWGNYVVFRLVASSQCGELYFIFDGCTCNVNRFRYMDLGTGTAGLLFYKDLHSIVQYIIDSKRQRLEVRNMKRAVVDDICKEYHCD